MCVNGNESMNSGLFILNHDPFSKIIYSAYLQDFILNLLYVFTR